MCLCKRIGQILIMIFIEDSSYMVSQKHHASSLKNAVFVVQGWRWLDTSGEGDFESRAKSDSELRPVISQVYCRDTHPMLEVPK